MMKQIVYGYLADSEGDDEVVIYCAKERAVKRFPKNRNIQDQPAGPVSRLDESFRGKPGESGGKSY